jgi:hypothetical protein
VKRVSHPIDRVEVSFDDPNLVANAGLLLVATLLGLGRRRPVNDSFHSRTAVAPGERRQRA